MRINARIYTYEKTHDKTIRFRHEFNDDLGPYYEVIKDMNTLIFDERIEMGEFSRFNKPIVLAQSIVKLIFGSHFNQPIVLTSGLRVLTFGYWFNQPVVLARNIQILTLGDSFNKPIVLTPRIQILTFGFYFDQPIVLTQSIMVLTFGLCFNQPIVLTKSITDLTFGNSYNQPIILTKHIVHLKLGRYFNQPIILTSKIQCLFLSCENYNIDDLTNSIKHLTLKYNFNTGLNNVPNSTKITIGNYNYKYEHLISHRLINVRNVGVERKLFGFEEGN